MRSDATPGTEDVAGDNVRLRGSAAPVECFDAVLLDLDGVLYRGPDAVRHAPETVQRIRAAGVGAVFVTNNANRSPETVAEQLTGLGVPAAPADVMTSALAAAAMLREQLPAGAKVLAVGGPGLRAALEAAGFTLVRGADDEPVAVVQGYSPTVSWLDLAEAGYAIAGGARYVATNLDLTIPTDRGIAPGNGSLVAAVQRATGVVPDSAGKPQPAIFLQAAARAGSTRPIVVGDRLDTDIEGAVAAGMPALHVLTGVDDARAVVLAARGRRPTFLAGDLRGLLTAHPEPARRADGAWTCGEAVAGVEPAGPGAEGVVGVVESGGVRRRLDAAAPAPVDVSLDEVRALCCAAWEAADKGRVLGSLPLLRVVGEDAPPAG